MVFKNLPLAWRVSCQVAFQLCNAAVEGLRNRPNRTTESRDFLGTIVAEIQVHTRRAVICYTFPLPGDSPLAGMRRQEVDLPEEALA